MTNFITAEEAYRAEERKQDRLEKMELARWQTIYDKKVQRVPGSFSSGILSLSL